MKDYGHYTIKGKTYDEQLQSEEGRSLMRWLLELPIDETKDVKIQSWTKGRNKWIKEKLSMHPEDPELTEKKQKPNDVMAQLLDHEVRIQKLEKGNTEW